MRLRSEGDDKFIKALRPAVESAITASINQNPKPLSDALFPVMGPAIRKAINHSISSMLQSLNQTLEHSFSAKGLQWRLDAFRTGKSFAEIVMLNTLVYRVEQVFLIHKETGLLLKHLSFDPSLHEDADMVSSMLTAVRDFIHDSFATDPDQETQSMRLGELEIIVEQAPDAVLAVVCRGNTPRSLHHTISVVVEEIQREFHTPLQTFDGDATNFEACDEALSTLMVADYANQQKQSSPTKFLAFTGLFIMTLCAWWGWNFYQEREYKAHWQGYIEQLRGEPGVVITNVLEKDGVYTLSGLRDPLSIEPSSLLAHFQLDAAQVRYQFQAYHALETNFVLQRAIKSLQPPSTVTLKLQKETLFISGSASKQWTEESKKKSLWIAGIESVDVSQLSEPESLLDRITKMIQPPQSITLQLIGNALTLKGEAMQAWVENAAVHIQGLHEVVSYDDADVIRIDSTKHLLAVAKQVLQPPSTVQLQVMQDKTLVLQGFASQHWIRKMQKKASNIRFIKGIDTDALKLSDDVVLQRAIKALQPPVSVQLSFAGRTLLAEGTSKQPWISFAQKNALSIKGVFKFNNQVKKILSDEDILHAARVRMHPPSTVKLHFSDTTLVAEGHAPIAWIEQARKDAQLVKGVLHFVDKDLRATVSPWQRIALQVQVMQLESSAKKPMLTQSDQVTLKKLVLLYKDSLKFDSATHIHISSVYNKKTKLVATIRLKNIYNMLINDQVSPEKIHTHLQQEKSKTAASAVHFKLVSSKSLP